MTVTGALAAQVDIPAMYKIERRLKADHLTKDQIVRIVRENLDREEIRSQIRPGMRIALTCGSRGVANIAVIIRTAVDFLKEAGALPFVVPAMGSHGGATAEGQKDVCRSYGVTEESMGCPLLSSMEVVQIGTVREDTPVYMDKNAAGADGIVVIGRIKPHTGFRYKYESGLMKMMVIGLGKQKGAETWHPDGLDKMGRNVELAGKEIIKKAPILCGLGIIENCCDQTWKIVGLTPQEIIDKEPEYLLEAKAQLPAIPFPETDVLIVDQIGKDISGDGMDPNITGTFCGPKMTGGIKAENVVVLDLTESSHGCAIGMGMADYTTRHFFNKIDLDATYPNAITSKMTIQAKIPVILANDKEAVQIALRTCLGIEKRVPKIIRIKDTLHLEEFWISEGLLEEARKDPEIRILEGPQPMRFDDDGRIVDDWKL